MQSRDGTTFDLRNITSPIIVFTSLGDNISPPPQTLGWILDLYRDVDDIRATGRTIVYCLNQKVGHLAIFVSSKVGAKEDEEFVQLMDVIDCLPPGLYEMVISPRPADLPPGEFVTGDWIARFETRSLDDIRALGRNSPEDDRAFAAAARLSELNLSIYRTLMQPMVRALANQPMADLARTLNPLRLSYTIFADSNPLMKGVQKLAAEVTAARKPAAADNPFLALQKQVSDQIIAGLNAYRVARDQLAEQMFFGFYGSPFVQALLGLNDGSKVRPPPGTSPEKLAARKAAGGGLCGQADDRRVRRGADPGGAVRHRRRADARPALRPRARTSRASSSCICRSPRSRRWCATSSSCCSWNANARWTRWRPSCRRRTRGRNC